MSEPSRKQLTRVIAKQRKELSRQQFVLRAYRMEIIRLGGDPSVISSGRWDAPESEVGVTSGSQHFAESANCS